MDGRTAVCYGDIEPHRPTYKGQKYDSDLERDVAIRLDELGVNYTRQANINDDKYPYGHYTADFFLPQYSHYIEVTPVWDARHETCCKVTHETGHNIAVVDGEGYWCDWTGKRLDMPNFLYPHKKGAPDSESLYEQGVRRKADERDAESIAPDERGDASLSWMTIREFAEVIGAGFLKFTDWGNIYYKGYTPAQHEMARYIKKAFSAYKDLEREYNYVKGARDNAVKALDAIQQLTNDGVSVKLCRGTDYRLVCSKHISNDRRYKAVYMPKSGVIVGMGEFGISGLDDLMKLLNGMSPSDIAAQHVGGES